MSRGRATINQTFFAGEIYLLFLCFKRFEFEYDTKCGRIYIYIFFKKWRKSAVFRNFRISTWTRPEISKTPLRVEFNTLLVNVFVDIAPLGQEVAYNSTLCGEHKKTNTDFPFSFELGYFLRNSTPGGVAYINLTK